MAKQLVTSMGIKVLQKKNNCIMCVHCRKTILRLSSAIVAIEVLGI